MSKRYQGGILGVGFNPLRAPNAPTIGTATAGGNNCASVAFTAPACVGGSAITSYTARSNPTGFGGAAASSPVTVTGLTNGSSYTFGAFALNSYGPSPISAFSNSITAVQDGTLAIFALGSSTNSGVGVSTTRNKYTYSGNVVGAATAATTATYQGSAAGTGTVGIFALGSIGPSSLTTRNKYTYSGDVVSAGGAATAASSRGSAAGNSTVGIFALGSAPTLVTTRNKYTYSGDVVSAGGAATVAGSCARGAAAGNSTVGIFVIAGFPTTNNKYTYSGDVVSAGAASTFNSGDGSAAGNSTVGIFALGNSCATYSTTRRKYTYSGCVVSAGSAATAGSNGGAATGNSVVGIFALGQGPSVCCVPTIYTTRDRYTYSGCVVTAGGAATAGSYMGSAAGNGTAGVNT
jgi:hypothetical protein